MKVWNCVFLLPLLCSCATPGVVTATPGGIEIDCGFGITCSKDPQYLADMAQRHCQKYGLDARQTGVSESASGRRWADYACVNIRPR